MRKFPLFLALLPLASFGAAPANDPIPTFPIGDSSGAAIGSSGGFLNTNPRLPLTPSAPSAASVGTTSSVVLAANASRKGLFLMNLSLNTISLSFGVTAQINAGITLYPGGTYQSDAFSHSTAAVNAISSAASSALSIQEFQ